MMKKLMSLLLMFCLMVGMAMPALASEGENDFQPLNTTVQICLQICSDGNGPLNGFRYTLHLPDGSQVQEATSDANGRILFNQAIRDQNYLIKESHVPEGYCAKGANATFDYTPHDDYNEIPLDYDLHIPDVRDEGNIEVFASNQDSQPVSGAVFTIEVIGTGEIVDRITTGADGHARSKLLPFGSYYVKEKSVPAPYIPENTHEAVMLADNNREPRIDVRYDADIPFENAVTVYKTDGSGNPLPGVVFGVFKADDTKIAEITTDAFGKATSPMLPEGQYYLKELRGLDGYQMDTIKKAFTISSNQAQIETITVVNPRIPVIKGKVQIVKKDDSGDPLSGVVFGIYDSQDGKLEELTTGFDGKVSSGDLVVGSYYVKELNGLDGYLPDNQKYAFTIMANQTSPTVTVINTRITGSLKIVKVSDPDAKRLQGAVFVLSNAQGQQIAQLITDQKGEASYSGLPKGEYALKELTAPEGYVVSDTAITFSITQQGQVVEKTISNKRGFATLELSKTSENDEKLGGVVFEIYSRPAGEKVSVITTDANGKASAVLPLGKYELKETKTADGYGLPDKAVEFELKENGATLPLAVKNKKLPIAYGHVKLTKLDEADSNKKLQGAVFGIYKDGSGNEKIGEITTGTDGTVTSQPIPEGKYYLLEQTAPQGYALSDAKHPIAIEKDKTVEVTVTNKALPSDKGILQIVKTDKDKNLLSGAVFAVFDSENKKVADLTTGTEGMASLELPAGKYTIQESKAPEGYILSEEKKEVTIVAGKTESLTVLNAKMVENLQIVKSASGTGERLQGAVFGVYKEGGTDKIAELSTDQNGLASMQLAPGNYFLLELKAPTGYVPEKTKIPFAIKRTDEVIKVEVSNVKQDVLPSDAKAKPGNAGSVSIPKTGQAHLATQYALASVLIAAAFAMLGSSLLFLRKRTA